MSERWYEQPRKVRDILVKVDLMSITRSVEQQVQDALLNRLIEEVPKRTGELADSLIWEKRGNNNSVALMSLEYAQHIIEGSYPVGPRGHLQRVFDGMDSTNVEKRFRKRAGREPNDFRKRALDALFDSPEMQILMSGQGLAP
jgi:hypothetical protein